MITKMSEIINNCKREVYKQDCANCSSNEKDCLINLINEYNSTCEENEEITSSDIE